MVDLPLNPLFRPTDQSQGAGQGSNRFEPPNEVPVRVRESRHNVKLPEDAVYRHVRYQIDYATIGAAPNGNLAWLMELDFSNIWKYMPRHALGSPWIENVQGSLRVAGEGGSIRNVPLQFLNLNFFPAVATPQPGNFPYPDFTPSAGVTFSSQIAGTSLGKWFLPYLDFLVEKTNVALNCNINDTWAATLAPGPYTLNGDLMFDFWVVPPS